jgi:hypothetical protein
MAAAQDIRKFVDMTQRTTDRWVNTRLLPGSIQIGTYMSLDGESGQFTVEGHIHDFEEVNQKVPEFKEEKYAPVTESGEERYISHSDTVKQEESDSDPKSIKLNIANDKPGAFLVMSNVTKTMLPTEFPLAALRRLAELKFIEHMFLVTEIVFSPSYTMGLVKRGENQSVSITKDASGAWQVDGPTTVLYKSQTAEGQPASPVLLRLKKLTWGWKRWYFGRILMRDSPPPEPSDDKVWEDLYLPWADLDDDGVEQVPLDEVFDSDTGDTSDDEQKPKINGVI